MNEHISNPRDCPHEWQPLSFAFETQLLDADGRVRVRQPDLNAGKVFFVCASCSSHTYMRTQWVGFQLYGSEHRDDPDVLTT